MATKLQISLRVGANWPRILDVTNAQPEPYVAVLAELAAMQADLRRLETAVLRLMHQAGITDEAIGDVQGISPQMVGRKRRRRS